MPDASLAGLALRLAVSMGVVIGLMVLAAKVLRRAQAYAATSGSARRPAKITRVPIEVQTIAALTRGASVALVRAAGQELVVGITEQQITLLHAGPEPSELTDPVSDGADPEPVDWDHALTDLIDHEGADAPGPSSAARIAALVPTSTGGSSAWMDALEMLRARTVRR